MQGFILLVNKPIGITSHDVVDKIRTLTGRRRVGHAGTLDPLAGGLLIILIGRNATKHQSLFMAEEKAYSATLRLGATSDTDDAEGVITQTSSAPLPTREAIEKALEVFRGEIQQVPPIYSAIKLSGKKAYELARAGETPQLKPRTVTITSIQAQAYNPPSLTLDIVCSKGTYIRSIARDLGSTLGTGAYLTGLTRTRSGHFLLIDAIALNALNKENIAARLVKVEEFL